MKGITNLKYEFVEFIPEELEPGTLYISMRYKTGTHLCCCGCGNIVVTPISPTDWKLIFDGKTVTLHPSIGSWSFPCQSHYWIRNNRVEWAPKWSPEKIEQSRLRDGYAKEVFFAGGIMAEAASARETTIAIDQSSSMRGFWQSLKKRLFGWRNGED
jgi:hypothetical protein